MKLSISFLITILSNLSIYLTKSNVDLEISPIIVRIDGKDHFVTQVYPAKDGILGDYIVIEATSLQDNI